MKIHRLMLLSSALAVLLLPAASAESSAASDLTLAIHHSPTNFQPGGRGEFWFEVANVGDTATSEPITVKIGLGKGLTRQSVINNFDPVTFAGGFSWSCPGKPGDSALTCTTTGPIPRHQTTRGLRVAVNVTAAKGAVTATAKLAGGGTLATPSATETVPVSSADAAAGVFPASFEPDFLAPDGLTPVRESGAHPEFFITPFEFNTVPEPTDNWSGQTTTADAIHQLEVNTPPGFIGNATAVGECKQAAFTLNDCPPSSMVGRIDFQTYPVSPEESQTFTHIFSQVFNLSHPRGSVADLGFVFQGNPVHIKVSLDPTNNYALRSRVSDINETLPIFSQKLTLWGVPADHSHDSERCILDSALGEIPTDKECTTDLPAKPFLSIPSGCGEHSIRLHHYDFWENIGSLGPDISYTLPGAVTNCEKPRFEPEVEVEPTGKQANTPTGLDVRIKVAQNENPNALNTPPVKSTVVTLPEGMSFSPSFADGLQGCTTAQMTLGTNDPVACPYASRIGEATLTSPLLPKALEGSMYLAAQGDNPFGSTFAMVLVLHDIEERGVLIKVPARIDVDPATGQIKTVFDDLPQFPFSEFTLKFRSGPRAPLVSPPTCGAHVISAQVASYAQPGAPLDVSGDYQITEGPNGTPCPPGSAARPFAPAFSGGTLNPVAGAFSTFLFRLNRQDDEQELSQVTTILPPGLLAKIAGIPLCPEAAINSISAELGAAAMESAVGSCPPASQLGTVAAGLGAGPGPNFFPGRVYLAGPYKGAPLSLVIVAPALAGPFDLGNVVVRVALRVDPETSRVTAVSDPFPTILHGVILRVRDVRLRLDRAETMLNPTNCSPMSLDAEITGVGGNLLSPQDDSLFRATDRFQVGDCSRLAFKPKIFFKLKGGTHRGDHPALFSRVVGRPGDANIAKAIVVLPRSEFLENAHIRTVCTRVQFRADACPPDSVYGHAKAITPLLDEPIEGDVILRSSNHLLPDLVARLRGRISANLVGRIDSAKGRIRTSFESVPDVPVSEFTLSMFGGKRGLLANSRNLCIAPARADARFTSQSDKGIRLRPIMQTKCKKAKRRHSGARKPHKSRGSRQGRG